MIFDTITLILGAAVLLLAALTALLSPFRRDKLPEPSEAPSADIATDEANQTPLPSGGVGGGYQVGGRSLPPLTLLVTVQQKQAHMLRRHLPQLLSQDYEGGYEVVVVGEKSDSDTEDILNSYADNPLLYATYVPDSSRYMSRKKLAITLGVKAAHNEWIVMTDAYCSPSGDHWLQALASHITDNATGEKTEGQEACPRTGYQIRKPPR